MSIKSINFPRSLRLCLSAGLVIAASIPSFAQATKGSENVVVNDSIQDHSPKNIDLTEVTVKADRIRRYPDHDDLFLSDSNRRFGTSSLDAISSMPEFQTTINGNSITTATGEMVTLLINGKKTSYEELKSYPVEYIKKVTYYPLPPAKYIIYGNQPVIDVIMKRSLRGFYSVRYSGDISSMFKTDHYGSFLMSDSLSVFRVWLNNTESAINGIRSYSTTEFKTELENYSGISGNSRLFTLTPGISYQRNVGKSRWNFSGKFDYEANSADNTQDFLIGDNGLEASGKAGSRSKFHGTGVSIDSYYEYKHDDERQLVVNVVNTWYHNNTMSGTWRLSDSPVVADYLYPNRFRNKTYSLIAEATYSNPLWGGVISPGVRYLYKTLNRLDKDKGSVTNTYTQTYEANLAYSRRIASTLFCNASINAYVYDNQKPDGGRVTQFTPDYILNFDYTPSRSFRLNIGSIARNITPSTNDLAGTRVYKTDNFSRLGNTNLKSQHLIAFNITPRYNAPSQRFSCAGTISFLYVPDSWSSCVYFENENSVVNQLRHLAAAYRYSANFSCQWMPSAKFTIEPFVQCKLNKYSTLQSKVTGWTPYGHLKFIYTSYPFTFYTVGSYNGREYNGGTGYVEGFWSASVIGSWSHRNITLLLQYLYIQQGNVNRWGIPGYRVANWSVSPWQRNSIMFQFVYRFSKGREQRIEQKYLNNSDTDRGI